MGYHPRIETAQHATFNTIRTRGSRLWFVNNPALHNAMLGYFAKYAERYNVVLYAIAIQGNHIHYLATFPRMNRSEFTRDLHAAIAKIVPKYVPAFDSGNLWGRRYSSELLARPEDVEHYFFYTVLQSVKSGLAKRISDYPGYNCFHDAAHDIPRRFTVTDWAKYNAAKKRNPSVKLRDYQKIVTLRLNRLPGHEHRSQNDYAAYLQRQLETRRLELIKKRTDEGLGFLPQEVLLATKPGSTPLHTKTSTRDTHRPRVLSLCPIARAELLEWYFLNLAQYRLASKRYRAGDLGARFPEGMYRPHARCGPSH